MLSLARKSILTLAVASGAVVLTASLAEASSCSLSTSGSTCSFNQGLFTTDEQHPTGTGFIDPFLRIQSKTAEQGYNTSDRPVEDSNQVKVDPNYTRDITIGEIGEKTLTVNGVTQVYYEFFLDINEPGATAGAKNWITLDQLEIYVSSSKSLNQYSGTAQNGSSGSLTCNFDATNPDGCTAGAVGTKIYDMDNAGCTNPNTGCDNYVQLNYLLSGRGSGSGDMAFYLPKALFGNISDSTYVYLFSQFGDLYNTNKKYESQAGFEEWYTHSLNNGSGTGPLNPVPEPASLLLVGTGLGMAVRRWRRKTEIA